MYIIQLIQSKYYFRTHTAGEFPQHLLYIFCMYPLFLICPVFTKFLEYRLGHGEDQVDKRDVCS
jgi:hypothetical protein